MEKPRGGDYISPPWKKPSKNQWKKYLVMLLWKKFVRKIRGYFKNPTSPPWKKSHKSSLKIYRRKNIGKTRRKSWKFSKIRKSGFFCRFFPIKFRRCWRLSCFFSSATVPTDDFHGIFFPRLAHFWGGFRRTTTRRIVECTKEVVVILKSKEYFQWSEKQCPSEGWSLAFCCRK